jgi:hypothetical protein
MQKFPAPMLEQHTKDKTKQHTKYAISFEATDMVIHEEDTDLHRRL